MEFLSQRKLEEFAGQVQENGIWLREVTWVSPNSHKLFLLNLLSEIVPENQREAHQNIKRFSYALATMDAPRESFGRTWDGGYDSDMAASNIVIQADNELAVQNGWKPLVNSITSYSGIDDPIILLPLVDFEINFFDHGTFIESVGRMLPSNLIIVVVSSSNLPITWDSRRVRNPVYCLTDGQYSALRQNKVRKYESEPLLKTRQTRQKKLKLSYVDPVTGFTGVHHSDKPYEVAIKELTEELGFHVEITGELQEE